MARCGLTRLRRPKSEATSRTSPLGATASGEVAEWSIAPHSKCGVLARVPGVRIPPSPPHHCFRLFLAASQLTVPQLKNPVRLTLAPSACTSKFQPKGGVEGGVGDGEGTADGSPDQGDHEGRNLQGRRRPEVDRDGEGHEALGAVDLDQGQEARVRPRRFP